jgi:hypothetical protein
MVYRTPTATGPTPAAVTDPGYARYFRIVGSGTYRTGVWTDEIAQVGLSFVFGQTTGDWAQARIDLPSTLIEGISDNTKRALPADFIGQYRVWQTENINAIPLAANTWIHADESDAIAVVFGNFLKAIAKYQDPNFYWDTIKIYPFNTNHTVINGPNEYRLAGIKGTGGTANAHAPQTAVATSFYTNATQRGATGRTFVPATHMALTPEGLIGGTVVADLNTSASNLVKQLWAVDVTNAVVTSDNSRIRPAVVHRRTLQWSDISGTMVGDQVDTQRRRRNQVTETYAYLPLTAGH